MRQREAGEIGWTISYFAEIGIRGSVYAALKVNDPWGQAYKYNSEEVIARRAAGQYVGNAPGPGWLKNILGDN